MFKKYKYIGLPVVITCLTALLSFSATALSASNTANFLPAILHLLDDSSDSEFGSRLPGKLFTAAELDFWRERANNDGLLFQILLIIRL